MTGSVRVSNADSSPGCCKFYTERYNNDMINVTCQETRTGSPVVSEAIVKRITVENLRRIVQVNLPFRLFIDGYGESFIQRGLNQEIGLDAPALDRFQPRDCLALVRKLHEAGRTITLHAPFTDLSPGSPDEAIRDVTRRRFRQLLEWVAVFEPKTLVAHANYDVTRYGPFKWGWLKRSVSFWRALADRLKESPTRLVLENVYEWTPENMKHIFEAIDHPEIGFCLDIGHQSAFGRAPLENWVDVMAPFIRQLHLHDNDGRTDQHLAIGAGTIDFQAFFKQLSSLLPTPPVITLEPHREDDLEPALEALSALWPW